MTSIGSEAFSNCSSLTSITIPESVKGIGHYAFNGCSSLTSITIPESVTYIGWWAFKGCSSLTSINIPEGVKSIESYAFAFCFSLTSITIPESVTYIDDYAFAYCSSLTSITIPEGVTSIDDYAFSGCSSLTSINIPEGSLLTSIRSSAFYYCSSLTSITIPESVTSIGSYAFRGCSSLTSINIPKGVTSIENGFFDGCINLTTITIPEDVTSIGSYAFRDCKSLTTITIPENSKLTSIGEQAFRNCSSLTSITIPEGVTSIEHGAFWDCSSLYKVTNYSNLPLSAGSSGYGSVAYYAKQVIEGSKLTTVGDFQFLTSNGIYCLVNYIGKDSGITLPNDYNGANYGIGTCAFYGCSGLTSINIPEGVTSIGDYAFGGCTLDYLIVHSTSLDTEYTQDDLKVKKLLVPESALNFYKSSNWNQYCTSIESIEANPTPAYISNPSFEGGTCYDCDNGTGNGKLFAPEGWQVTYTKADWGWKSFQPVADDKGQNGSQYFEFWAVTYHTLDLSQEVNLPAGTYGLSAAMRTERADQVTNQHIYAKVGDKTYTSATLGAPIGSKWDAVDAWQTLSVVFTLDETGPVTIGATSTGGTGSKGWFQIDNFQLYLAVPVSSISLNKTTATIYDGETLTLSAMVSPSNATDQTVTWTSSNTAVATVDGNGKVTGVGYGTAIITAKAGSKTATCEVKVTIPVSSISLNQASAAIKGGETLALTATIDPSDATDKMVTWSSSNTAVATVDNNGKVTGVGSGTAIITATAGGKSATCEVNVTILITGISLSQSSAVMSKNETLTLAATIDPRNATDKTVTWSSSNTAVATVDGNGKVTAKSAGTATITAKAGGKTATCEVKVTIPVNSISLNKTSAAIKGGETLSLSATITPSNATDKTVTWTSSNTAVATVDNNGKVTGVAPGTATITAKAGGKTATCEVKVTIPVSSISLNKTTATIYNGETLTLSAMVSPSNATDQTVTWTSSNTAVATVDINGKVTSVAPGTATITAKAGEKTATCEVKVEDKQLEGSDATSFIANPSFEGGTYNCDNGTNNGNLFAPEGWQVTYTNADWGWKNFQPVADDKGKDGNQYFEFWGNIYHTLDLSQKLRYSLPAGTYELSAAMRTQRADQVTNQHIYAKVGDRTYESATLGAPIGSKWNEVDAWQTLSVEFTLDETGPVTIGATSTGGTDSKGWFQIDNFRLCVAVNNVSLNKTSAAIKGGETLSLNATVSPSNAANKTVTWTSSNTAVATVDSNGKVTGVGSGTAIITAKAGSKTATCEVNVKGWDIDYATGHLVVNDVFEEDASEKYPWYSVLGAVASVEFGPLATTIGAQAFADCNGLMTVTMSDAVTSIGTQAFANCSGLMNVEFSDNLGSIGAKAFAECTGLTSISFTNKLVEISEGAFTGCTGLTSANFANGLEIIGAQAFERCTSLISIALPSSVKNVGATAFKDCTGLKSLDLGEVVIIGANAFENCDGLINLVIPSSIRSIQNSVFTNCDGLVSVTIPESVTNIGTGAFADCDGLPAIVIPNSVTIIGANTFADCDKLASITIPNSVTNIGANAFEGCDILGSAVIGDGVTIIGVSAFAGCPKLTEVTIGNSVSTISTSAFEGCSMLNELIIGSSVTTIGASAFSGCEALTNVIIPNNVTNIASAAFAGCEQLGSITIGKLVGEIQNGAFEGCEKLKIVVNLSSLNIEKGSTKHGHVAYYAEIVVTEGLFLDFAKLKLTVGESATLTATLISEESYTVTWSTSNSAVATVSNGKVTAKSAGTAIITATVNGKTATCEVIVENQVVAVTSITLSKSSTTLAEGESETLTATVMPDDATNKTVTWSSDNSAIATVSDGKVTAKSAGTAIITATADGKTATCVVTVEQKQPEGGDDSGDDGDDSGDDNGGDDNGENNDVEEPGMPEGDATNLIANPSFEGGTYNCDNGTGFGNLNAPEGWQVTYTNADWGWKNFQPVANDKGQDGSQYFEFWAATYHTLDLSQELCDLPAGSYVLSAAMRTESANQVTNQHIYAKVSGEEFASTTLGAPIGSAWNEVDAWQTLEVTFTLNSKSNVVIGATSTGGTGSKGWFQIDNFRLSYSKGVVEVNGIELDKSAVTMFKKDKITLTATVTPNDATNVAIAWSSDNTAVATVSNGVVTAVAEGTATITAKAGDKTATCVVTVEKKEIANNVADGVYYLYNVDTKKFLSRGEYWGTCATVDKYGIPLVWGAEEYSLKFLDNNLYLFETDDNNLYTDNASTGFAFEATDGGYLLKSLKSDRYLTIVDGAHTLQIVNVTDDNSAAMVWQPMSKAERNAIVADYVTENYSNVLKAADIPIETEKFLDHVNTRIKTDKTSAIGTARFNGEVGSWTYTEVYGKGTYGVDYCELSEATGYYTQTITGLEKGIYKVTMQGFERSGSWQRTEGLAQLGHEITTATLTANGEEVNLKSWYSGKSDECNPDSPSEAVAKFAEGEYMNEVYTYVGEDGKLTLMVNKPSRVGGNWVIFNNFTLTHYSSKKDSGIESSVLEAQGSQPIYDLMGRRVEKAVKGFYIINGKRVLVK